MMLILNRLRGTQGLWSKIIGLLLALIVQIAFNNTYVALAVGLGYIVGESFGWGLWVGTLSVQREKGYELHYEGEGRNNGIEWIASHIVKPTQESWINYCRVALSIRGFYWWLPTLAPLYFVGFSAELLTVMILALSIGFPIACELGYYSATYFSASFNKDTEKYEIVFKGKIIKAYDKDKGFSVKGGWEHQEVWYGLMQDIVFIFLIWGVL